MTFWIPSCRNHIFKKKQALCSSGLVLCPPFTDTSKCADAQTSMAKQGHKDGKWAEYEILCYFLQKLLSI